MGGGSQPGGPPLRGASGDTFASLLDRLKRRGTTVLVVGDLSSDMERVLSRRMMGHPNEERYRMLAALKPLESPDTWFPGSLDPGDEWVDVADHGGLARDATAVTDGASAVTTEPPLAASLVDEVDRWLSTVDEMADPDPGQIRVGVTSLDVLEEREDVGGVRRVAERLGSLMRENNGVAHLYYARDRSSQVVQQISVWVDVVVEMRATQGRPEQRWSVQDTVETSWFPIRDDDSHYRIDE